MSAPLVRTEELSGGYRPGTDALTGVTFAAEAGEVVAILGPNGGGKSTLFRALLGELPQRRGTVELAGRPAYVPQTERARLDFPVSALDVALMGAYGRTPWYRRLARADRAAARAALARVGLETEAGERFGALSGGQRQRVLIARALVQDAPVLLLAAVAGAVVVALAAVGALLVSVVLVVPAATVRLVARDVRSLQLGTGALAAVEGVAALWLADGLNVSPGPAMAVLGGAVFALVALLTRGRS